MDFRGDGHLWFLLLSALALCHCEGPLPRGYLVAAPSVFRAGVEEAISVTFFNPAAETAVQACLAVHGETVAHSRGDVFEKGVIKLKVPRGLRGQAHLRVWGSHNSTSKSDDAFSFQNSTTITVEQRGSTVLIQTDKPVYKPKQRVLANFIIISPELRPINEKVEAYIVDPRGSRMVQWSDLHHICCGIMNVSFPISEQPIFGEWMIFVELHSHTYNKSFEVQKYVLPKFEVDISTPSFIRNLNVCDKARVRARYTFGKPVRGKATVNMTVNGVGYYRQDLGMPVLKTFEVDGAASFDICVKDLMPPNVPEHFRGALSVWATVVASDGSKQIAFDDSTLVHKQLVDIKYSRETRKQFKPGLPYHGKLEVTYPDGSPADGVTVRIKAELAAKDNIYTSELVSRDGIVAFQIHSIPTMAQYVWLEAKVTAIDGREVGDQYLSNFMSITGWFSPSKCHLQLQPPAAPLKVGEEAKVAIRSTCPCNVSLHYEVAARGNIVQSGAQSPPGSAVPAAAGADPGARLPPPPRRRRRDALVFDKNADVTRGSQEQAESVGKSAVEEPVEVCEMWLRVPVTHAMVPSSRLLVYYVRANGEGVADSVQIPVKPSFENEVSLELSQNETSPGDKVDIVVRAAKGSCACVAAVDKSVHLLKPGYQLSKEKVFKELAEFDVSESYGTSKEDSHFWWPGISSRRRRSSIFPWHWDITKDARFAFTEAGLTVMTDIVRLNHRQNGGMFTEEAGPAFQPHTGAFFSATAHGRAASRADKRKRTFFPETWIWHCFNTSAATGEARLQVEVPDSITSWVAEALAISPAQGLGLAPARSLRTFKPFFVDFTLPYALIRGEQAKVPLTVHNYMPLCAEVHVKVTVPKGVKFVGHHGKQHLTRKMCVEADETKTTSLVLSFAELGQTNITARAFAYGEASCCEEGAQTLKGAKYVEEVAPERRTPMGLDYIMRSVLVEAEGMPREYTYSVFFCPNEHIHISTPNKYEYQYVQKPARITHFALAVKAHNDARLALAPTHADSPDMLELVLGGQHNTRSWIAVGRSGPALASAATPDLLSWDEFRTFWVSWADGLVQVGRGQLPSPETVMVRWQAPRPLRVNYVGLSTGWGSLGEFKIWRKEESDGNHNEAFTLAVPHSVVPGSERATASMIGDVMGPTLNNLDNLLKLPFGCGEQNMIHFAPNVFVLKYLQRTKQLVADVRTEVTDYLLQGYQRQLTYKRQDGSYSAFGERDSSGSMWLTAFVLKSFAQSRAFIYIDPKELAAAKAWIINHQKEDGSFPAVGRILNKDIQGGIHGKISLTAYVVAALIETGTDNEGEKTAVARAKVFLESNMYSAEDPYTTALSAYALTLLHSSYAPVALRRLNNVAITQDGLKHWSLSGTTVTNDDTFMGFSDGLSQSVVSAEVEMTAYALLTYTALGDVATALPIVKWLSQQRNAQGGFSSTQDTCVALQSLSEYAILSYIGGVNLTISLASTNLDFQESFELNKDNKKILQTATIPSIPTGLFVSAKGEGCCLMQIDVSYNVPDPAAKPAFQLTVELTEPRGTRAPSSLDQIQDNRSERPHARRHPPPLPPPHPGSASGSSDNDDDDPAAHHDSKEYKVTLEVCARWLQTGSSNMAVLEVPLLSGFRADVESLEQVLLDKKLGLKRYELDGRKVLFYFDEIPNQCMTCVKFHADREYIVGQTAPVPVKIYDYYEPALEATRFYNASANSPLARELCEGKSCNEVESSTNQWIGFSSGSSCNVVYGCGEENRFSERCTCYRDCGYDGEPVCGSDGVLYPNRCQLEVAACRNNTRLEQVPVAHCAASQVSSLEEPREIEGLQLPPPVRFLPPPPEPVPGETSDIFYEGAERDYEEETFVSDTDGETFDVAYEEGHRVEQIGRIESDGGRADVNAEVQEQRRGKDVQRDDAATADLTRQGDTVVALPKLHRAADDGRESIGADGLAGGGDGGDNAHVDKAKQGQHALVRHLEIEKVESRVEPEARRGTYEEDVLQIREMEAELGDTLRAEGELTEPATKEVPQRVSWEHLEQRAEIPPQQFFEEGGEQEKEAAETETQSKDNADTRDELPRVSNVRNVQQPGTDDREQEGQGQSAPEDLLSQIAQEGVGRRFEDSEAVPLTTKDLESAFVPRED
ncbi:C3 and PZP-like alpha-2-macroglobulin domain-containing protein 8 [Lampetra fluviatilis]